MREAEKMQAEEALGVLDGAHEAEVSYVELMQISIAGEPVLIAVSDVSEVIRLQPLSLVPMAPDHLLGVCNVHGQILCVIDPCRVMRLEGNAAPDSPESRFMILRHKVMNLALRVDAVSGLFRIQESKLVELTEDSSVFFRGAISIEGCIYRLIDTEALFA